jgi:sulfur carrier protein ThiS
MENLAVFAAPLPFSHKQVKLVAIVGSTIEEIVALAMPKGYGDAIGAVVQINGHSIPREHWARVKPKLGSITVVNVVPGKQGKNPLALILTIAVLIAAPYAGAALAEAAFTAGAIGSVGGIISATTFLTGAVGLVGTLLVSALAPPPKPSNFGSVSNPSESATQFIEGASNQLTPYGVIPQNLGTNRMFPILGARNFTETQDSDQYARQLFVWSYGSVILDQFNIGDTAISEFDDLELEHKQNGDLSTGTALYANSVDQDNYNVLLQQVDGYTLRTSQLADELLVDVTFPSGLAQYNTTGARVNCRVQMQMQFAPHGVSPQVWSPAANTFTTYAAAILTPPAAVVTSNNHGIPQPLISYRRDIVVVNNFTGAVSLVHGPGASTTAAGAASPTLPANSVRIASLVVKTTRPYNSTTQTTIIESMNDDRSAALYGTTLQDSSSFIPTLVGATVHVSAGGLAANALDITASQSVALRKTVAVKLPSRGVYDVRIERLTDDSTGDQVFDKVYLTAIRSVRYTNPWILANVSGTAMRIRGTDQLNGTVDQFNAIVSTIIPDYDEGTGTWISRPSSNPASIYRYVLQGPANSKPLADDKIDIAALEAWHIQCATRGYTYNRVIDYETSVADVLADVAAAGAAAPDIQDGLRTVVVDLDKTDIVQVVTPRNSWGYSATIIYPVLPHALRAQFRNPDTGYLQDEVVVYADGYNSTNATIFETLELQSCTNSDLAYKTARRHFAVAQLRPETHVFNLDVENLVALRGQRIKFASDVPQIGVGDGRIKSLVLGGTSPQTITAINIDDVIAVPKAGDYYVRIRLNDGTQIYTSVVVSPGYTQQLVFRTPVALINGPDIGDLLYVVEGGKESDLIISKIEPSTDLTAKITALNYAPDIFTAENGVIPPFQSNVTTPLSLTRPVPPVLLGVQSDESAMVRNSDGSIMSRIVISLQNNNGNDVETIVQIRASGATVYGGANVLESTPTRVVLTGLDDGTFYDIAVRYKRAASTAQSLPLMINSYKFIGAGTAPNDVQGFDVSVVDNQGNFSWLPSTDIDFDHWVIKFSSLDSMSANWDNSQILEDHIMANRITIAIQSGTYLIKAIDIDGNESVNASIVDAGGFTGLGNVVQVYNEDPGFTGVKDNTQVRGSSLILADPSISVGYYYFANTLDLGAVYTSLLSAAVVAGGGFYNDLYAVTDLFAMTDMYAGGGFDLFSSPNLFAEQDLFGIGSGAWTVALEYRTTQGSTAISPVAWSDWTPFNAGSAVFQGVEFRAVLTSLQAGVTPQITGLQVTIDMPDRVVADNNISVPVTGFRVIFDPAFLQLDGLAISTGSMNTGDYYVITLQDETGFTIQFFDSSNASVVRVFSYVAKGYGKVSS